MNDIAAEKTLNSPVSPVLSLVNTPLHAAARLFMFSIAVLGVFIILGGDGLLGCMFLFGGSWGWQGFKNGAIRSLCSLISTVCVYIWAQPVGKFLAGLTSHVLSIPVVPHRYLSILMITVLFLICGQAVGRLLLKIHQRRGDPAPRAHGLAMILGMTDGALLALTLFIALAAIEGPARISLSLMAEHVPWAKKLYDDITWLRDHTGGSTIARKATTVYADQRRVLETGAALAVVSRYPGTLDTLKRLPEVRHLLADNPVFKRVHREIRTDLELRAAVKEGDIQTILNSPTVYRLMEDQELARQVEIHYEDIFDALILSVQPAYQVQAAQELARIQGVSLEHYREHVRQRLHDMELRTPSEKQQDVERIMNALQQESIGRP